MFLISLNDGGQIARYEANAGRQERRGGREAVWCLLTGPKLDQEGQDNEAPTDP